jgi:hypothetical protein
MTKDKKKKTECSDISFTLTRMEIEKLFKITEHFKEVNLFTIEQSSNSGIGVTSKVRFDLFEKKDTNIDITDVMSW